MKKWTDYAKKLKEEEYRPIFEVLYLAVVAVYILKIVLDMTLFEIDWPDNMIWTLRILLGVLLLLKLGSDREHISIRLFVIMAISGVFIILYIVLGLEILLDIAILAVCTEGATAGKTLKIGLAIGAYVFLMSMLGSFSGVLPDLVYEEEAYRHSFGIGKPAEMIGFFVFFAVLVFFGPLGKKSGKQPDEPRLSRGKKIALVAIYTALVAGAVLLWKLFVMYCRTLWNCLVEEEQDWAQVVFLLFGVFGIVVIISCFAGLRDKLVKRRIISVRMGISLIVFIGAIFLGAVTISKKNEELYAEDIEAESVILEALEGEAGTIYVDDLPLMYLGKNLNLGYSVFWEEGMADTENCILLTKSGQEFPRLFENGFYYGELSTLHSVYTNSEEAADALLGQGIWMTEFFSSENSVNLESFLKYNDVKRSEYGSILINGPEESLWHGPYSEMEQGVIHVEFKLHLENYETPDYLATVRVAGYSGEFALNERRVTAYDFDEEGNAVIGMEAYLWEDMDHMEFLVIATEGTEMELERITWRRIG